MNCKKNDLAITIKIHSPCTLFIYLYAFIAKTPLQSRVRQDTHLVVMCTMSQCKLRCPIRNVLVTNAICIVAYYTLPPIESPDSFWMTRSQRSRRRDKGLWGYRNDVFFSRVPSHISHTSRAQLSSHVRVITSSSMSPWIPSGGR